VRPALFFKPLKAETVWTNEEPPSGCIASFIRLSTVASFSTDIDYDPDPTWTNVNLTFWTLIEVLAAVVCACAPALWALILRLVPSGRLRELSSVFNKSSQTSTGQASSPTRRTHEDERKRISVRIALEKHKPAPLARLHETTSGTTLASPTSPTSPTHGPKRALPGD
jgi:hypothetical protein